MECGSIYLRPIGRLLLMSRPDFIEQQKRLYKSLQPCYCPAIQATVYFNAEGLKHLLYDQRHRPRKPTERCYKLGLIDHIIQVITEAKSAIQRAHADPLCQLWVLGWIEAINEKGRRSKIKVILRKLGNGNVHFLSVMKKKEGNSSKNGSHRGQKHEKTQA